MTKKDDYYITYIHKKNRVVKATHIHMHTYTRQYKFVQACPNIVVIKVDTLYEKKTGRYREKERNIHSVVFFFITNYTERKMKV